MSARPLAVLAVALALTGCDNPPNASDYATNATNHTVEVTEDFGVGTGAATAWVLRDRKTGNEYMAIPSCGIIKLEGRGK